MLAGMVVAGVAAWGTATAWGQQRAPGGRGQGAARQEGTSALLLTVERSALPPPTPEPFGAHLSFEDVMPDDSKPREQFTVRYFTTPLAARMPLVLVFDYCSADAPTATHSMAMRLATTPAGYLAADVLIPPTYSPVLHWRATLAFHGRVLQRIESADWPKQGTPR